MSARRLRRALPLYPEVRWTWQNMYDLVLAETGDEDTAQHAASDYASALERAKSQVSAE